MSLTEDIAAHLNQFHAAPYAFVGSGLSRRYLQTPTWASLLAQIAAEIGKDFDYYRSRANGDLPYVASLLAADFHEAWFRDAKFEASRQQHASDVQDISGPLKVEISRNLRERKLPDLPAHLNEELALLQNVTVDAFITTNWDLLLEKLFSSFRVFRSPDELLFSPITGIAEIYKIHGCATAPSTLVLTEKDYSDFNARYPYLAAKLLTVFVEHPVIFLGYSLSDPNIQGLIGSLARCLRKENISLLQDRLILVEWDETKKDGSMEPGHIFAERVPVPIRTIKTASFSPVFEAMATIRRKLPARILRRLKEQVYELVRENDPKDQLYVLNLDDDTDESKVEIVYGVGLQDALSKTGYKGLQRKDIIEDVAFQERDFDPEQVLTQAMPHLLKGKPFVPVFKYLRRAGRITGDTLRLTDLDGRVIRAAQAKIDDFCSAAYRDRRTEINAKYSSLTELLAAEDKDRAVRLIPLLAPEKIPPDELLAFIREHYAYFQERGSGHESNMKRLICLYDYLRYGPTCSAGGPDSPTLVPPRSGSANLGASPSPTPIPTPHAPPRNPGGEVSEGRQPL